MTPEQSASFVNSQAACMLVAMEAMKAANERRRQQELSDAYGEDEFLALIDIYGCGHNTVVAILHNN